MENIRREIETKNKTKQNLLLEDLEKKTHA